VATQAVIKTLSSKDVSETKTQILICNTFHLHIRPGEELIERFGGLQKFMSIQKPLMTDSGGFQVFSLGFGRDFGTGKILKKQKAEGIEYGQQPKLLKITDKGVRFRSFLDGKELFLGPVESIRIQEKLGADIIFAFDECTSPMASKEYTRASLSKTHEWAEICLKAKRTKQALYGIVQGGKFKDLRKESARFIGSLPFEGFGIGGEFGDNKKTMIDMLKFTLKELPEEKPRHLLGIGYLQDIPKIIKAGVDTFDCIVPTHYARRGMAYTFAGELDLNKEIFKKDKKPLDSKCSCAVCQKYSRGYIHHLLRAKEITGMSLLTFHNLYFFNSFVERIRKDIKSGRI
jgi:queuine tRNA-ribosyltransferase/7-cyano-7-deazaguanine tRNA-ribosyltransferase